MYCGICCMFAQTHLKRHYEQYHLEEDDPPLTMYPNKKPYHYYVPGEAPTGDSYCKNWIEVGDDQIGSSSWVSRF